MVVNRARDLASIAVAIESRRILQTAKAQRRQSWYDISRKLSGRHLAKMFAVVRMWLSQAAG